MQQSVKENKEKINNLYPDRDIAVIGMAGRFPRADNLEEYWENLEKGKNCIGSVPESRLNDWHPFGDKRKDLPQCGYMNRISTFDARFFGIPPEEAALMDPCQRLLLEVLYEAFEYGGYGGGKMANTRTGVFIACSNSNYRELISPGDYSSAAEIGVLPAVAAGRLSHIFDLRGPSLLIDTACSSSLSALHFACQNILDNECSMAVVGAINIYAYMARKMTQAGSTSPKNCNVFDNSANGMVNSEGVGALLLKPLPRALKDGDIICAVIKGTAINHNGGRTPTVSGQNLESQAEVILQALEKARVNPDTLSYFEASGAADPMGDLFEIESLSRVFAKYTQRKQFCPIGSVKTNIGHLNHASGMASLIKVILAMNHKKIPPLIRFKEPNVHIDFKNTPVYIETQLKGWKAAGNIPRRAGVSSFSVSGTNCHVIVEEPPRLPYHSLTYREHYHIITISAKSGTSLKKLCNALKECILDHPDLDINDICFTQNTGRGCYDYRLAVICRDIEQLIDHLNAAALIDEVSVHPGIFYGTAVKQLNREDARAVFLFSSFNPGMEVVCLDFLNKGFISVKYMEECNSIFPLEKHPAVLYFAFQYALARMWMDAGIKPAFVLGFGIGKYVSKAISGTMDLHEALDKCNSETREENTFNKDKFIQNIELLYAKKDQRIFLEIGIENSLGRLARETLSGKSDSRVLDSYGLEDKERTLLESIALLYTSGVPIDFSSLFPGQKVRLPVYPFDGKRYWVKSCAAALDIKPSSAAAAASDNPPDIVPGTSNPRPDLDTPYSAPSSEIERNLASIFQGFFHMEKVGIHDDFFKLGGDSLKVMDIISRIHQEFHVEVPLVEFFAGPTIKYLVQFVDKAKKNIPHFIQPVEKKEFYPLSSAQNRLYIIQQMNPDSKAYNQPILLDLVETLQQKEMEPIFKKLIRQHEALRTSFKVINGTPMQVVHGDVPFLIQYFESNEANVQESIKCFFRPFDLDQGPLMRVGLASIENSAYLLMMDSHHIISDAVSRDILIHDFFSLYFNEALPALKIQYKDYSEWQNSQSQEEVAANQEKYWLQKFSGALPVLALPTDFPRPPVQSFAGDSVTIELEEETQAKLTALAVEEGITIYMLLLACYNILLYKLTGQEDIIVGTDSAGRKYVDLQKVIGMFVNTLALRNYPRGEKTFPAFLKEVKKNTLEALENQDYQFEKIVEQLVTHRDMSRNPLFDAAFFFLNRDSYRQQDIKSVGFVQSRYYRDEGISLFDLVLFANEQDKRLSFTLGYCTKLFTKKKVETFAVLFKEIINSILEDRNIKLKEIKCALQLLGTRAEEISPDDIEF